MLISVIYVYFMQNCDDIYLRHIYLTMIYIFNVITIQEPGAGRTVATQLAYVLKLYKAMAIKHS